MPLVSRTRATLRSAEFGFFGVCVKTRTQTPRFCGLSCSAGLLVLVRTFSRPLRTSWLIVGTFTPGARSCAYSKRVLARICMRAGSVMVRRLTPLADDGHALHSAFAKRQVRCSKPREPQNGPAPGADLPYKV